MKYSAYKDWAPFKETILYRLKEHQKEGTFRQGHYYYYSKGKGCAASCIAYDVADFRSDLMRGTNQEMVYTGKHSVPLRNTIKPTHGSLIDYHIITAGLESLMPDNFDKELTDYYLSNAISNAAFSFATARVPLDNWWTKKTGFCESQDLKLYYTWLSKKVLDIITAPEVKAEPINKSEDIPI